MSESRVHVLHVEDQLTVAAVVQLELERAGIEVLTVSSGEECLMVIHEVRFDLVLVDESLRGMNGLELCRRLKADQAVSHLPVIFLSGNSDPEYIAETRRLGAADYLLKGEAWPRLAERIHAVLEEARARSPQQSQWIHLKPRQAGQIPGAQV